VTTAQMPSPEKIRDYILRRLPDEARGRFEEAYFSDDALLERVDDEENRLVSDYVLGRLDEADRRRFEEALLGSPYYRRRVETSGQLEAASPAVRAARPAPRSPFPSPRDGDGMHATGTEGSHSHRVTLLPGRTGTVVAFALLVILLVAALLAAWTLRRDLVALRRKVAAAASPGAVLRRGTAPPTSARGTFLLLDDAGLDGPPARRLPAADGPLVLVVPAYRLPPEAEGASIVLLDESGLPAWKSGAVARSEQAAGGVVAHLPAGLPVSGRGALLLVPEDGTSAPRFLAALLRDEAPPEPAEAQGQPQPQPPRR